MTLREVPGPTRAWGSKARSDTREPAFYKRYRIERPGPQTYLYDEGTFVASGNGVTRVFTFPHALGVFPRYTTVDAGSPDARPPFTVVSSAEQITVTFAEAPLAGMNNVSLVWLVTAEKSSVYSDVYGSVY